MVLRALLFVHGVMAIGMVFAAPSFPIWLGLTAAGSSVALPGVLIWLLALCALKRPLAAAPLAVQWLAAIGFGALAAWLTSTLVAALLVDASAAGLAALAGPGPALAGGGIATIMFEWLRQRAKATVPAETTARLAELQSRIRPHFLFNTLNTALTLVRLDPAKAEGVSRTCRAVPRRHRRHRRVGSLAEEVELAQRYLDIEQIASAVAARQLGARPGAGSARVPPFLLQPCGERGAARRRTVPDGGVIRIPTKVKVGRAVFPAPTASQGTSRPGTGMALKTCAKTGLCTTFRPNSRLGRRPTSSESDRCADMRST